MTAGRASIQAAASASAQRHRRRCPRGLHAAEFRAAPHRLRASATTRKAVAPRRPARRLRRRSRARRAGRSRRGGSGSRATKPRQHLEHLRVARRIRQPVRRAARRAAASASARRRAAILARQRLAELGVVQRAFHQDVQHIHAERRVHAIGHMDGVRRLGQRIVVPAARQVQDVALPQRAPARAARPSPGRGASCFWPRKTGCGIGHSARPSQMFQVFSPSTCTAQTSCVS